MIYATAKTLIINNRQTPFVSKTVIKVISDPSWKKIIKSRIELGELIEIGSGVNTRRMNNIKAKLYNIQHENERSNTVEILM